MRRRRMCRGLAPTDALESDLVATLVSGLVPTNALATTATGNAYRVAFTSWALTSQGSLVRSSRAHHFFPQKTATFDSHKAKINR